MSALAFTDDSCSGSRTVHSSRMRLSSAPIIRYSPAERSMLIRPFAATGRSRESDTRSPAVAHAPARSATRTAVRPVRIPAQDEYGRAAVPGVARSPSFLSSFRELGRYFLNVARVLRRRGVRGEALEVRTRLRHPAGARKLDAEIVERVPVGGVELHGALPAHDRRRSIAGLERHRRQPRMTLGRRGIRAKRVLEFRARRIQPPGIEVNGADVLVRHRIVGIDVQAAREDVERLPGTAVS